MPSHPIMPTDIAPPAANYAHAVLTTGVTRWLHTSGVVPVRPDGSVPDGLAEQANQIWANLTSILRGADLTVDSVVSVTTYVTTAAAAGPDLATVMAARDAALGGRRVASTLLTVPALAQPAWLVEVALVAAA
ncbi:enamine deaminase RidA (YjgF/YER057c/UK114 family) [Nakamurella sp. UYEF19]|uniref:RidA family protein n=1 Tax=Nakamurella sp. UYEF19 TaxID=1756392 RepID=UPI0033997FC8